jgi:hypothetical protein
MLLCKYLVINNALTWYKYDIVINTTFQLSVPCFNVQQSSTLICNNVLLAFGLLSQNTSNDILLSRYIQLERNTTLGRLKNGWQSQISLNLIKCLLLLCPQVKSTSFFNRSKGVKAFTFWDELQMNLLK